jgi:hypothetical protein
VWHVELWREKCRYDKNNDCWRWPYG